MDGALKGSLKEDGGLKGLLAVGRRPKGLLTVSRLLLAKSRLTPAYSRLPLYGNKEKPAYAGLQPASFGQKKEPAFAGQKPAPSVAPKGSRLLWPEAGSFGQKEAGFWPEGSRLSPAFAGFCFLWAPRGRAGQSRRKPALLSGQKEPAYTGQKPAPFWPERAGLRRLRRLPSRGAQRKRTSSSTSPHDADKRRRSAPERCHF